MYMAKLRQCHALLGSHKSVSFYIIGSPILKMAMKMAALALLLLTGVSGVQVTPIQKVLTLMEDMKAILVAF
jgi:hypothetical protein